jgi:predicted RNA-binding Zn ribbon-like protein
METKAPLLGEPLALELANAAYAVRGRPVDGIQTVTELTAWLHDTRARFTTPLTDEDLQAVTGEDLLRVRALRAVIRDLAAAVVRSEPPPAEAVEEINRQVRLAPRWHELAWADGPYSRECTTASPLSSALAELASSAVDVFAGQQRSQLRACEAPGCILFFVKDHARREWCSAACGNRVRAARHYEKHKRVSEPQAPAE